jgi:hypothetical protein
MVLRMSARAKQRAAISRAWTRRSLVSLVAITFAASGCSSSDSVDAAALPRTSAPRLALAVDANLASDLPPFNDGNGHGEPSATSYAIGAAEPESLVTAALDDTLPPDQIVEATFTTTGSPEDTGYGVVCRRRDNDNYYRLGVGNDGTFAIAKVQDGTSTVLTGEGKWIRDRRLIKDTGTFIVRGECRGPTLRLFVDNQPIIQIADATFDESGTVGVFVETFALPNATITVNRLSARGFVDRSRVTDATASQWDALLRAQAVTNRCSLLEPTRLGVIRDASFVSKCGTTLLVQLPDAASATREYQRLLGKTGTSLEKLERLPDCSKLSNVEGPLPPPTPPAGPTDQRTSIGRVACLDIGDNIAVVWLNEAAGVIGAVRVAGTNRRAWKGYGRNWPPFVYEEQPG